MLKSTIQKHIDPEYKLFTFENKADYLLAVSVINQFQFLGNDSKKLTCKTKEFYIIFLQISLTQHFSQ